MSRLVSSTQLFDFQNKLSLPIFYDQDHNEWFHAAMVCGCLKLTNPAQTVQRHVDPDWYCKDDVLRGVESFFVTEQGLYQLAFRSEASFAEEFRKEIFEFLKKLRIGEVRRLYHLLNKLST